MAGGQRPLAGNVVVTVRRGNDDAFLISVNEFGVHHDARDASVAVGERVYFGDQEVDECGTVERRIECPVKLKTALQGADDRVRPYELDCADAVRRGLELAWRPVGASLEHACMTVAQHLDELRRGCREATHLGRVGHDAPNAQHVVCVGWKPVGNASGEDDRLRFLRRELRSLDVVREVGFEERQRCASDAVAPLRRARRAGGTQQLGMQLAEPGQASRVVGLPGRPSACRGGREPGLASARERPDDSVEFRELRHAVDDGGDTAGVLAQTVARGLARGCEHALEMCLDVPSTQRTGQSAAPCP